VHVKEADATANVARDDAGEHVEAEVKVSEAPEGADAGRDLSLQAVGAQVEREQESEVTDSRGDGAGEPLGSEVQGYHPPPVPPAAGDTHPAAVAGALVPRVQHAGVARDLGLESHKSSLVVRPWVMASGGGRKKFKVGRSR